MMPVDTYINRNNKYGFPIQKGDYNYERELGGKSFHDVEPTQEDLEADKKHHKAKEEKKEKTRTKRDIKIPLGQEIFEYLDKSFPSYGITVEERKHGLYLITIDKCGNEIVKFYYAPDNDLKEIYSWISKILKERLNIRVVRY